MTDVQESHVPAPDSQGGTPVIGDSLATDTGGPMVSIALTVRGVTYTATASGGPDSDPLALLNAQVDVVTAAAGLT